MTQSNQTRTAGWHSPLVLGLLAALLLLVAGVLVTNLAIRDELESGIPADAMIGFAHRFSWWVSGALGAFAYVSGGVALLRLRARSGDPFVRAAAVVAVLIGGAVCPLAVTTAVDLTVASYPGFICIIPSALIVWSPWFVAVAFMVAGQVAFRRSQSSAV